MFLQIFFWIYSILPSFGICNNHFYIVPNISKISYFQMCKIQKIQLRWWIESENREIFFFRKNEKNFTQEELEQWKQYESDEYFFGKYDFVNWKCEKNICKYYIKNIKSRALEILKDFPEEKKLFIFDNKIKDFKLENGFMIIDFGENKENIYFNISVE